MTKPRVVILDGATLNPGDNPWAEIERLGDVVVFAHTPAELVIERSSGAAVLVINKVKLPAKFLEQLPELKLIAVTATGYDCVDAAAARKLGIAVCNVPIYGTDSVAQHTLALILHLCHRVDLHDAAVHAGEWTRCPDFSFWKTPLIELTGKTIGLVGVGRIGRRVGELAHAFGMNVLAYSRHRANPPQLDRFAWAELSKLVVESDVVSLHCPLTDVTRSIVNADFLRKMKRSAFLVNTSRGGLVAERDLADALNAGTIAAAAVDVLSTEPPPADNPLFSAKNCVITPHNAWATLAARQRLMQTTAENIRLFLAGSPANIVN